MFDTAGGHDTPQWSDQEGESDMSDSTTITGIDFTDRDAVRAIMDEVPSELLAAAHEYVAALAVAAEAAERDAIRDRAVDLVVRRARNRGWCETADSVLTRAFGRPEGGPWYDSTEYGGQMWLASDGMDRRGNRPRRFDADGFDQDGFNIDNRDHDGRDRSGYDLNGRDRDGFDYRGYDPDGYNRHGFNDAGLDREGYDWAGFHGETGLHRETGRDRYGYDAAGLNEDGLSKWRFDQDGWDADGYDRAGFHRVTGRDRDGYGRNGYDENGRDRAGYDAAGRSADGYERPNADGVSRFAYRFDRFGNCCPDDLAHMLPPERVTLTPADDAQ